MEDQWIISQYNSDWKAEFQRIGFHLRRSLGELAIRIDHIGSTSVVGMDAKPIIDIQVSVIDFDDVSVYKTKIEQVGFVLREMNPDKTKKYFREMPGARRTHVHVRRAGSFGEQMTLLFRDYLRTHPADAIRYAREKHRLMSMYKNERPKYVEGKGPMVWNILQKAHRWSQEIGWNPSQTDV